MPKIHSGRQGRAIVRSHDDETLDNDSWANRRWENRSHRDSLQSPNSSGQTYETLHPQPKGTASVWSSSFHQTV